MKILTVFLIFLFYKQTEAVEPRISKGQNADIKDFPYQSSIRCDGLHICGGTIISPKHIMTAAHCVAGMGFEEPYDEISVLLGSDILKGIKTKIHPVSDITWHKDYVNDADNFWHKDIAIITLEDLIKFDETQAPALLPKSQIQSGSAGVISGWGRTSDTGYTSKNLQKGYVKVLSTKDCQEKMNFPVKEGQICGLSGTKTGICKGDSGGPLVVDGTVVGISSWNTGCGTDKPDVFTNVYDNMDFINKIIH